MPAFQDDDKRNDQEGAGKKALLFGASPPGSPPSDVKELKPFFNTTLKGGVQAAGVGLRTTGVGEIILNEIPSGSKVTNAWLYWTILANEVPEAKAVLNGVEVRGNVIGTGPSPNWPQEFHFTFRAAVTQQVQRSGSYKVEIFDSGEITKSPSVEGAAIVAIFSNENMPETTIVLSDGSALLLNQISSTEFRDFTVLQGFTWATLYMIGADGQGRFPDTVSCNGQIIGENSFKGSDGRMWDTSEFFVKELVNVGDTKAVATVDTRRGRDELPTDSIVWVGSLLAIRQGRANVDGLINFIRADVAQTISNQALLAELQRRLDEAQRSLSQGAIEPAVNQLRAGISDLLTAQNPGVVDSEITRLASDFSTVIMTIFFQDKKEILVNFKFGKGTSDKKEDRDKMVKTFLDSLKKYLVKDEKNARFGVNFKEGKRTDIDIPAEVTTGASRDHDEHGDGIPGSYEYNKDAKDIIHKHGNKKKLKKITVIVVKSITGSATATTFSSNMRTLNGEDLGDDEGIIIEQPALLTPTKDSTPAHEITHLAGAPDAPSDTYVCYVHLNGHDTPRSDKLPGDLSDMVDSYFNDKTETPKE